MTLDTDILIIGGGISGLLTARELRLAGRDITIIDKSNAGQEASWAGGGILLPIYPWRQADAISDLVLASIQSYPNLSSELRDTTGIDPEWLPCGMLICKNPDYDLAIKWCKSRDIAYQSPPAALLNTINTRCDQPLWLPDIAQARNPRLLKSLKAYLLQKGVRFIENAEITGIEILNRCLQKVHTSKRSFIPNQTVVCAGAWSAELLNRWLPHASTTLQIQPVRGQMLLFDAQPDTLKHMILDGDHYLIPRRDGKILAGSTVEQAGFTKITTTEAREHLYSFAIGLMPDLKNYPVCEHWAGLRPGTPEGIPYIGFHPDVDNLSVNAGHFRNGLVMGPASARLLADLILQRTPTLNPTAYALNRN
ncbi:NAD(P)/FAD-dependent oxidoreductase [Methylomonas methanica]|uniref:FAD dependent oxidoreductase n=1 Tax=Methylomonas methanica (strain DSM 25384 / MC09) TaxID=857087 RepID=G0A516_METMM|nr:FAD-dependent oxidoreductase [Methylomonas methanica]AEF99179.1 FAD dependent oxidoreductase [Methylomonas methanica MC09]